MLWLLEDWMLFPVELTNKATGEARKSVIEADDFATASDLASKMQVKLLRETGTYWFLTVSEDHTIGRK